ncbi:MAG: thioredoxin family protein [Polyangiaceae bacterium]|nr:thioredoxin family protein [Polyangiaceae bacterium]
MRVVHCIAWMLALVMTLASARAWAQAPAPDPPAVCGTAAACGIEGAPEAGASSGRAEALELNTLFFFWGIGCPHCEEAKPAVEALAKERPDLRIESIEIRQNAVGRQRYIDTMERLGAEAVGIPTFVVGNSYIVGYTKGETDEQLRALVSSAKGGSAAGNPASRREVFKVPWIGEVDSRAVSLPWLTVVMGLADGVNPCAMWVLVVLLGILMHVDDTRRMLLYAGTFVVMSGVVYFIFMTAWSVLFSLAGLSAMVTTILGVVLLAMGLINLKDVVWFKKGPSLVIPDKVKPGLFRRMRAIANAATTPAALAGITMLAFVVNLVELGCTVGLPAVYTRILSLRGISAASRFGYLALYNVIYVVPLLAVVAAFIGLKRRFVMTERAARVLKAMSGMLLVTFGTLFLLAPELLAGG